MEHQPVFLINSPDVPYALGIEPRVQRRYSYAELYQASDRLREYYRSAKEIPAREQSPFETEIVRTYYNFIEYISLASTFGFLDTQELSRTEDPSPSAALRYESGSSIGNPPPHCISAATSEGKQRLKPPGFIGLRHSAAFKDRSMAALLKIRESFTKGIQGRF